jgi:glycine betaine/proline transport system substrate-binding protein
MLARLLVLLAMLVLALPAAAQERSVETLGPPDGASSGETIPAEPVEPAPPPPCGTQPITMARMQWPSSAILAEIHARILRANFACEVRVQEGDMAAAGSSMGATGQPAVVPELWIARIAEIWNAATKAQKVRQAGNSYAEPTFEGWFVPDYVVAQWPEVTTIEGLKAHASAFATGGTGKGRFVSCPVDWGCSVVNRNMLRANGLDALFDIVEPANRFELDTLIAEAVSRKEPILFYYWQPNAILAQFAFNAVDLGPYNKDNFLCLGRTTCGGPLPTGFAPDPVIIAVSEWVFLDAPQVAAYFGRARMPLSEMNAMLQASSDGTTPEDIADRFVATREDVWRPWLGLPVPGPAPAP